MVDKDLLAIEVRLLLVKYGYVQLTQALATIKDSSVEKIEDDIRKLESSRSKSKTHTRSINDIITKLIADNPIKAKELKALAIMYNNRSFLPQLRDVKQFLAKYSSDRGVSNSRASAASQVFLTLSALSISQLQEYLTTSETDNSSDLAIFSDQILGNKQKNHKLSEPLDSRG